LQLVKLILVSEEATCAGNINKLQELSRSARPGMKTSRQEIIKTYKKNK
jgi:hypothetical protein